MQTQWEEVSGTNAHRTKKPHRDRIVAATRRRIKAVKIKKRREEMRSITKEDVVWSAGFFEGEGNICCTKGGRSVSANQKDHAPLLKLQHLWGGRIRPFKAKQNGKVYLTWQWTLSGKKARLFLREIRPYITTPLRKQEIKLYFEFYQTTPHSKRREEILNWQKTRIAKRNKRCEAEIRQYEL